MDNEVPIAIVAISCKFPGANNIQEYWRLLKKGENHVKEVPMSRWNGKAFYDPDPNAPGKTYTCSAGFVDGIETFDHNAFMISEVEAEKLDPQQRLVLQCVHDALQDGGIKTTDIDGKQIGVFIGCMTDDYKSHVMDDDTVDNTYAVTGTHNSLISARVSYIYNLTGKAKTIDTACSSSLVAIDDAIEAMKAGSISSAICGGVNLLLDPQLFVALSKAKMLSPSGQCRTFTKDADGYIRGEGCGIVILKPLDQALKDGNKIWGTIVTETNQDGRGATPITAPSSTQQQRLLESLYTRHKVDKSQTQLIEAHGTGTMIGDPAETKALGQFFSNATGKHMHIGSVKTNIGHLEAAAGVAGLIKVLLMMQHKLIVPSLWYNKDNENPELELDKHGFVVPTECHEWQTPATGIRTACVNSFGFGGTNAHAVVWEYRCEPIANDEPPFVLSPIVAISAPDHDTLLSNVSNTVAGLKQNTYDMCSMSCTSTCKRDHKAVRKAFAAASQQQLKSKMEDFIRATNAVSEIPEDNHIVFVFCGMGTAWTGMCRSLLQIRTFEDTIDKVDVCLSRHCEWSIKSKLSDPSFDIKGDSVVEQIAIFACQIGLTELWKAFGVSPNAIVGQSVGEIAAAYAAGILDLESAVRVIFYRSKCLATHNKGTMAVVRNVQTDKVEQFCQSSKSLSIAVYISPFSCTVSGEKEELEVMKSHFSGENGRSHIIRFLDVKCAYHHPFVEDIADRFCKELGPIPFVEPSIPFYATVETSEPIGGNQYWVEHMRRPVEFNEAIVKTLAESKHNIYIEIGPSPVMWPHVENIFGNKYCISVFPSSKKEDDKTPLTNTICVLYEYRVDLNWNVIFPCRREVTDIPKQELRQLGQLYQSPNTLLRIHGATNNASAHPYVYPISVKSGKYDFTAVVNEKLTPYVYDHKVKNQIILPGAYYADVGFYIGNARLPNQHHPMLLSLEFLSPVRVDQHAGNTLFISSEKKAGSVSFYVRHENDVVCKGVAGKMSTEGLANYQTDVEGLKIAITMSPDARKMNKDDIYKQLGRLGFKHGRCYQLLDQSWTNGTDALTEVSVPANVLAESANHTIHTLILDTMMQSTIATTTETLLKRVDEEKMTFMPTAMEKIQVCRRPEGKMLVLTKRVNTTILETVFQMHFNILLLDMHGNKIAEIQNYMTYSKRNRHNAPCDLSYQLTWEPLSVTSSSAKPPNTPIVFLARGLMKRDKQLLTTSTHSVIAFEENELTPEDFVMQAFEHVDQVKQTDPSAIVLFAKGFRLTDNMSLQVAKHVSKTVIHNCVLVKELIKTMTEKNITWPLYIVTENTQPSFQGRKQELSIVGSELWGFIRSVHFEFTRCDITLVDLQAPLYDIMDKLLDFIGRTCKTIDTTRPEILISESELYGSHFSKAPKSTHIPMHREVKTKPNCQTSVHEVMSTRSKKLKRIHLSPVYTEQIICEQSYDNDTLIDFQLKSIVDPPTRLQHATVSGKHFDHDIWDITSERGHSVWGIEYTGYIKCAHVADEECLCARQEHVAIYPSRLLTSMQIPRSCLVNLELLPNYKPGVLLYSMFLWKMVEQVSEESTVVLYCQDSNDAANVIASRMIETVKAAQVQYINTVEDFQEIDTIFTLEDFEDGIMGLRCRSNIICLEGNLNPSTRQLLSSMCINVHVFNTETVFDSKNAAEDIHDVVAWLHRNFPDGVQSSNNASHIPCKTISVADGEQRVKTSLNHMFCESNIYVVTGGLTGLGWELVQLLADLGAGTIVCISRRELTDVYTQKIRELEETKRVKVKFIQGDVANMDSLRQAFQTLKAIAPDKAIKGVFHGAGVLGGKVLLQLQESHIRDVLNPKVIGTMNIHVVEQEMGLELDYFVIASSISSFIGSPGQSNYGAANSFMDTFVAWRRDHGLAGQVINWGPLSVGMAAKAEFADNFIKRGYNLMAVPEVRTVVQEVLLQNSTNMIYTNVDWDTVAHDYTSTTMKRVRFQVENILDQSTVETGPEDAVRVDFNVNALAHESTDVQKHALITLVVAIYSKVIAGEDRKDVNINHSLGQLGIDSVTTVMFINIVKQFSGYRIDSKFMFDMSHTLSDVVELLHTNLFCGK